jgi:hypothetical protein
MKNAFVLVTYKPQEVYFEFLNKFTSYDVFVVIDDNSNKYEYLHSKYKNISFVQINNEILHNTGFVNTSRVGNKITTGHGWDKAVFLSAVIKKNEYNHVWISEEDVFFYDENTLKRIDQKYLDHDILCNSSFEDGKLNEWMWNAIEIKLEPPYFCGMMCCCRFSQKMLEKLADYAEKNKTLFYIEALFPTIAKKNNLKYCVNPEEFLTITYRKPFEIADIDCNRLYHPMKKLQNHIALRNILAPK